MGTLCLDVFQSDVEHAHVFKYLGELGDESADLDVLLDLEMG